MILNRSLLVMGILTSLAITACSGDETTAPASVTETTESHIADNTAEITSQPLPVSDSKDITAHTSKVDEATDKANSDSSKAMDIIDTVATESTENKSGIERRIEAATKTIDKTLNIVAIETATNATAEEIIAPKIPPDTAAHTLEEATAAVIPDDGVLTTGTWIKKKRDSAGTWSITRKDGDLFVELDANFKTRNAPDLKLFLSPLAAADVNKNNALDGSLLISPLNSNKGAQKYQITETDLSTYKSILIHCEQYTVLWSAADL